MIASPSSVGAMKASCFSAVMPVIGWNQCVKCVAPFSSAQSFIAFATTSAIEGSIVVPSATDFISCLKITFGRRSRIVASLNTAEPNISATVAFSSIPIPASFLSQRKGAPTPG